MKTISLITVSLLLAIPGFIRAQSLERQVLANSGKSYSSASGSLEFTVGETITNTMNGGSNQLCNGFHQGTIIVTNLQYVSDNESLLVYPNPSPQSVTIEQSKVQSISLELCDSNGRLLQTKKMEQSKQELDLSSYAEGIYFLRINQKQLYKIVKTK